MHEYSNKLSWTKKIIIFVGTVVFLLFVFLPPPSGLSVEGARAVAVFILCISFWVTAWIPLGVTSLMGMALIPLLGIMSAAEAFAFFGDRALFFILGALMLAAAIYQTGLGARIALVLLIKFDHKPKKIILGIMLTSAILSCIMPEHAVAAMLFPIVLEIARSLNLQPGLSNMGKALFLAMAWGAIIGGVTTYLGGARNILAVGLLEKSYGLSIGFFEWIKYSFPLPIIILFVSYFLIMKYFKPEIDEAESAFKSLLQKVEEMGVASTEEKKLMLIMVLVIGSWLFLSGLINIAVTAIIGGVLIFIFKVIKWNDLSSYVNWGVILMYGGAIVVATSLDRSGATVWLAEGILKTVPLTGIMILLMIATLTKIVTEGISNVAAVAIVLPIAFSTGSVVGLNPIVITLLVALSGGLAFCLPMGTPPNAIAYSSGYYNISDVLKAGVILNIVSIAVLALVAKFYWPLVGLDIFTP